MGIKFGYLVNRINTTLSKKGEIKNLLRQPPIVNSLFILFLLATFMILYGTQIPLLRPQSVHQWRQSDSASYALNYYQKNTGFFHPQTMNMRGEDCEMVSEFPIIYYLTSIFYKWFGFNEIILRLITYSFFAIGLFFLFKLSLQLFGNRVIMAFVPPIFLLSAPYVSYYALNFLSNVPALGMTLAAWHFYFNWWKKEKSYYLWAGMCFMTIGMLLKPIVGISLIAFLMTSIFKYFSLFGLKPFSQPSKRLVTLLISSFLVISINVLWIYFAKKYNSDSGYRHNLLGVLPIWNMEKEHILETFKLLRIKWGYQLYYPPIFPIVVLGIISMFFLRKIISKPLLIATVLLILGQICYFFLYFETFYHHDYYLINVIIAPLFILISNVDGWIRMKKPRWVVPIVTFLMVFTIAVSFKHSRFIIRERYFGSLWEGVNRDLESVEPYLRSIGVNRKDLVVSVPDKSPNISLYLMNQQGWTEIFNTEEYDMHHFVEQGAKYLIINDSSYINNEPYYQYTYNKVGQFRSISVFNLDQNSK